MPDYLIHHGIKGMRWGVRRYQNEDGTRTALGKRREQAKNTTSKSKIKEKVNDAFSSSTKKRQPSVAERVSTNAREASNAMSNIGRRRRERAHTNDYRNLYTKASNMSDADLTRAVNRLRLEEQYVTMIDNKTVRTGRNTAIDVLDTIRDVTVIAGSAVGTIAAITALTNKD